MEGGRGEVPSPLKLGKRNGTLDARTLLTGGSADYSDTCTTRGPTGAPADPTLDPGPPARGGNDLGIVVVEMHLDCYEQ